ncbi:glycosyltransferase family 2 protein [Roseovarius atlanticus]|uniref:glycosyltransferase family 2 protein n=1 Tax=Roseovarius atlanticus TaxID=1641875 RepID=UPI001C96D050|nr:glycosyltransferase family 2 protein [Roseovarius atlanticus]MBY5987533.1 glycosyltransferase [Roseovarius atlanticus]MBY6122924.1 glycosyltransferase [Roseovarius atlanticus]MBY6147420.1 glycosyltransferase [Roseovarius atlanticus]
MSRADGRSAFLGLMALAILLPTLAVSVVALAVLVQAILGALNLHAGLGLKRRLADAASRPVRAGRLHFSVHLATHDEPPALVARTLRAFASQVGAPEFEVIVLDNNTADPALWRPIETLCEELGPAFRFYHEEGVTGAKAGALNIALARTDPAATHVVIVDADYEVTPDFLAIAVEELQRGGDDFIQFPQAYRGDEGAAQGLSLELADYFLRHARHADVAGAMLLTGTLSVIRREAFETAGGWSGQTITEDAELGLRLHRLGYRGRFVDRIVGRGLLPLDLGGLSLQRYRWAAGNMDTARGGLGGLPARTALKIFAQLTAWANLALPCAAGLIGGGVALALGHQPDASRLLVSLSGIGLALVYLSACLPMIIGMIARARLPLGVCLAALASRIAMILPSALGTMDALMGRSGGFKRTAKDVTQATDAVGPMLPALVLCAVALLAVPQLPSAAILGAVLVALPYPLALATRRRLVAYRTALRPA